MEIRPLPHAIDPRNQAVPPGSDTSEYQLTRLQLIFTGIMGIVIVVGAIVLQALGRLTPEAFLALLGLAAPNAASSGYASGVYVKGRLGLKGTVARGSADVAVAEAGPATPASGGGS